MKCRIHELIGWLYDKETMLDWRISPLEILRTEREFPGLIDDLSIEAWQRKIVKDQIDGDGKAKEEPEQELA